MQSCDLLVYTLVLPLDRNTSSWLMQSSLSAARGFSFRSNATMYFERAAGSASHLKREINKYLLKLLGSIPFDLQWLEFLQ